MQNYRAIVETFPCPVIVTGQDGITITQVSAHARHLLAGAEVGASMLGLLVNEIEREKFRAFMAGGESACEFSVPTSGTHGVDPAITNVTMTLTRSAFDGGVTYVLTRQGDELLGASGAQYDPLTGLPNRELLYDRADRAIRFARRSNNCVVGILFIDLDRFKPINDTYGHAAGDAVLRELADRLKACLRDSDTVARLGGDEFVAVLSNLRSTQDSAIVADRILDACSRPVVVGSQVFTLSASIGIAVWPSDGESVSGLLENADTAMYASKGDGRNRARFYDSDMNEKAKQRATIEAELRQAIRNDEFVLHYQPQYSGATQRVIGAEALIRWQHPRKGLVAPNSFIGVAEQSNLIAPIGEWVLREAVRQAAEWRASGIDLHVAVNLSARQFSDELASKVELILTENQLPPEHLELELTESCLVTDMEKTVRILRALRQLGVKVALDDFGTGYSSLNYLKNFPVDTLKIDRSFICGADGGTDLRMVKAILGIAREFDLTTLAEGVETQSQLDILERLGCDSWQGYLLSRALPADEFAHFCRNSDMGRDRFLARAAG